MLLARCGFSHNYIHRRTGLSKGQISLRLKQTGSQVRKYRNGESSLASRVAETVHMDSNHQIEEIRAHLIKELKKGAK